MRIVQAHIYGFGKWVDQRFTFPSRGKIEISGNNETGKTTLRQFILYILFGLSASQAERFLPKRGATVGGRMLVAGLSDQPITIERVCGKNKNQAIIYLEDGTQQSEEWLRTKLQGMDRSQFQEIYTFDANDLQKIQDLDNETLNEVLLAIGMMGTDRIYYAEKTLEKKRAELFKPFGKKPAINQLFQQLDSHDSQLSKAKEKEKSYRTLLQEIEQLEWDKSLLDNEKAELEKQREEIEKRLTHYSLIEDYYLTCAQLKRMDSNITFPSEGLSRLKNWKEALLPLQSEENVLINNLTELEKKIANATHLSDSELGKLANALNIKEEINQLLRDLKQLTAKKNSLYSETDFKLKSMQLPVTLEEIEEMEFPFYLEEYWAELASQSEKLEMEIRYAENAFHSLNKWQETLKKKKQDQEKHLIEEKMLHVYQQDLEEDKENNAYRKQQALYKKWSDPFQKQLRFSNGLGVMLFFLSLVLFFILDNTWSVLVLIIAVLQNVSFRLYGKAVKQWLQPNASPVNSFTPEDIQKRQQIVEEQQTLKRNIKEVEKDLQYQQIEQLKLEERLNFLGERRAMLDQKIAEQTERYSFLSAVELPYWSRIYQQLANLYERLSEIARLKDQIRTAEMEKKQKEDELDALDVGETGQLPEIIKQEKEKQREYAQFISRAEELKSQLQVTVEKQKPYQQEINQLFQVAEVETEEEFIEKGEHFFTIQKSQQKYYQLYDSLVVLFSKAQIEEIEQGLYKDRETLEKQLKETKQLTEKVNINYKQKMEEISDRKASVALLEKSEDVSILKHQLALKQTELNELAKQWSIYQLAAEALKKAKAAYSNKYIPQVFDQASVYFERLTIDRYARIYKDEEDQILVKDKEGFSFQVYELSQATKDQLYIAIRLALSQVMANRLALPFLIDDGFVHFDKNRKEKIVELLEEISQEHQVLYFTAHAGDKSGEDSSREIRLPLRVN